MRRCLVGLAAVMVIAGFWAVARPDSISNAQTGCTSEGAVEPSETALAADCEVLLDIRDTLAGTATLNWAADTPIGDWDGIFMGGTPQRVTGIELEESGLTGTIPTQLGNLDGLIFLSLWDNQLTGAIPSQLGSLSNLTGLWLSGNQLTGSVPSQLSNLSSLEVLDLESNQLSGQLPTDLGDLSALKDLWLGDNLLSGPIPTELGNLSDLEALGLNDNQFTGEIPQSFTGLTSLTGLYFSNNAGLCAPTDSAFRTWLQGIETV